MVVNSVGGAVEEGMVSEVNGVRIELPWMLVDKGWLHWIRAQTGIQYTLSHLRPMMLDINGSRRPSAKIYSIVTDQHVMDRPSKQIASTSVYKMAQRFAAGDRSASRGAALWALRVSEHLCEHPLIDLNDFHIYRQWGYFRGGTRVLLLASVSDCGLELMVFPTPICRNIPAQGCLNCMKKIWT